MTELGTLTDRLVRALDVRRGLGEYNDNAKAITELYGYVLELARIVEAQRQVTVTDLLAQFSSLPTVNEGEKPIGIRLHP